MPNYILLCSYTQQNISCTSTLMTVAVALESQRILYQLVRVLSHLNISP